MDSAKLAALVEALHTRVITQYVASASATVLVYYYITTFDEEVSKIWPQPNWKLGKILYLASRWFNIARIVIVSLYGWPTHLNFSTSTCTALNKAWWGMAVIGVTVAPECIFWLCLYALLGGRGKHMILMVGVYLLFLIPIQILQSIYVWDIVALPVEPLDKAIGRPCNYPGVSPTRPLILYTSAAYLGLARTTLIMIVAAATLILRYWKHNSSLIKVIRREGGAYYFLAFVITFLNSVAHTPPRPPFEDKYQILRLMREAFIPMFADRLVLSMQRVREPGTQAIISSLVFDKEIGKTRVSMGHEDTEGDTTLHQDSVGDGFPCQSMELRSRDTVQA